MNFSLLGAVAGPEPGASVARPAARRADGAGSSPSPFREMVDGLSDDENTAEDAASATSSGGSPSRDASESPKARTATVDSSNAATNSPAAAVHADAIQAGTAAPPFADGDAGKAQAADADEDGSVGQAKEKRADDEDQSAIATGVLAALSAILPVTARAMGNANCAAVDADASGANTQAELRREDVITTGLEQAITMADEQAGGLQDRVASLGEGDAAAADFNDIAKEAVGLSAQDLAVLARARAASQSASEAAPREQTNTASASSAAPSLASFLKTAGAAASSSGDQARTTGPSAVVSHVVSFSTAASFAGLVDRASPTTGAGAAALPESTAEQIVQTLRLVATGDGGEARITLDPNQFGQLSVSVRVEQGQVVARVEADQPVVREWLQSNQHQLRHQLAGQQLTLDRLEVREPAESDSPARERREHADGRASEENPHPRRQRRDGTGARFEVVA